MDLGSEDVDSVDESTLPFQSNFLTTLRSSLRKSALGSFFVSYHAALRNDLQDTFGSGTSAHQPETPNVYRTYNAPAQGRSSLCDSSDTACITTPGGSRRQSRRISVQDFKTVLSGITSSRVGRSRSQSNASSLNSVPPSLPCSSRSRLTSSTVASGSLYTADDSTPPLTPSSVFSATLPSWPEFYGFTPIHQPMKDEAPPRDPLTAENIRAGKMPERSILYDELIADISNESPPSFLEHHRLKDGDQEEWFGLEYILEMSKRDQNVIECARISAGEHSRSRESWAAIHAKAIHPMFQDQAYQRWKKWHRYLDRQEEIRRTQKGTAFKARAYKRAELYARERRARDWLERQKDELERVVGLKYVEEQLDALVEYRPDPYFPPHKRNIAWQLKRSRTTACLRELRPLPEME